MWARFFNSTKFLRGSMRTWRTLERKVVGNAENKRGGRCEHKRLSGELITLYMGKERKKGSNDAYVVARRRRDKGKGIKRNTEPFSMHDKEEAPLFGLNCVTSRVTRPASVLSPPFDHPLFELRCPFASAFSPFEITRAKQKFLPREVAKNSVLLTRFT